MNSQESPEIDSKPAKSGFSTALILGLVVCLAAAIWGVMAIRANRMPAMNQADFDTARAKWTTGHPDSYDITVEVTGMQPGTYEVRVENGLAVAASFDGRALKRQRTFGTWAVPGMFDTLSRDLETNEQQNYLMLGAVFDPTYGFPAQYQRIEMRTGAHDALQWNVTKFEPHEMNLTE